MNVGFLLFTMVAIAVLLAILVAAGIAVSVAGGLCGYLVGGRLATGFSDETTGRPVLIAFAPAGAALGFALTAAVYAALAFAGVCHVAGI